MKSPCVDCHTIHNTQIHGPGLGGFGDTGIAPQQGLLNNSCYGCHTGDNADGVNWSTNKERPFVFSTGAPDYGDPPSTGTEANHTTLAGGSFYWVGVEGEDSKGHNVIGLATQTVRVPPGGTKTFNDTDTPLTCAGENGCHGRNIPGVSEVQSMYQSHHAANSLSRDGSSLAQSYRFLEGNNATVDFIAGTEDEDWELTVSSADHNQYQGMHRSLETEYDWRAISSLCARCHGDFHNDYNGSFSNPWFRHPVDFDLYGLGGEYDGYGGAGTYMVETPLGSADAVNTVVSDVFATPAKDEAIITCITCHRAHGSPYAFSLRWDYQAWPAGGYNGCGDCHTFKE